ncbi:MerR family transcriptional regulator [candidate division WWE3 bacterium]|uniref:MerR family transcriptional regulator n=1 Tax=candidate division WWE3 bacterium TaxID=2053526 RepID=A0A955LHD2_UNCKA|nr:MerR family transcriptional regulator [candidate division WWE3 bacterium]
MKQYSVNQLAKLAGISVRTLHYYDNIGLLSPAYIADNGYRNYGEKELLQLQQILFYRELQFSLSEIKKMVSADQYDQTTALREQRALLVLQRNRLDTIIETITKSINSQKGGTQMTEEELFNGLSQEKINEYKEEAKQRWGNTDAYRQSQERMKNWRKEDIARITQQGEAILADLKKFTDNSVESDEVQNLIADYHQHMNNFYDCSLEMFRGLGAMYVQDERFAQYYKDRDIDPTFMKQAMDYYCDTHEG